MNENELNKAILAELVKIAKNVFSNGMEIKEGTYTAAELYSGKDAKGNSISMDFKNGDEMKEVHVGSFKCSFPVNRVFFLVWQFEKLSGVKQAAKARFTKIDESKDVVCSFDMEITKEHKTLSKFVSDDETRKPLDLIFLDVYNNALVASDGKILKEYPVVIESAENVPSGLNLYINPKHIGEMVGKCRVNVTEKEGWYDTEIISESGKVFICESSLRYPYYRACYPMLSKEGFIKIQKNEMKAVSGFLKAIRKNNKYSKFSIQIFSGDDEAYLSYINDYIYDTKEISVSLEAPSNADMKIGFIGHDIVQLLSGWTGGIWFISPAHPVVFDDKNARIGIVMPERIDDAIYPKIGKCDIDALERNNETYETVETESVHIYTSNFVMPEKPDTVVSEEIPEKKLPALNVGIDFGVIHFAYLLLCMIDYIAKGFYRIELEKALQRIKMISELSGIPIPELSPMQENGPTELAEVVQEQTADATVTCREIPNEVPRKPVIVPVYAGSNMLANDIPIRIASCITQCVPILLYNDWTHPDMLLIRLLMVRIPVLDLHHHARHSRNVKPGLYGRFHIRSSHRIRDGTKRVITNTQLYQFKKNA